MIMSQFKEFGDRKIAIYGLGTETQRFLSNDGKDLNIICLLDGFRTSGEMYGYPILSLDEIIGYNVSLIIVVARPGSCKAITKRISEFCIQNSILLYDVRGNNLLEERKASFDFSNLKVEGKQTLLEKIEKADIISFDLFDTLVTRCVFSYTDIFDLMKYFLKEQGIFFPEFSKYRLYSEKELSKQYAPTLEEIYSFMLVKTGGNFLSAREFAEIERKLDFSTLRIRKDISSLYNSLINSGKKVVITTDSYYSLEQIKTLLNENGLSVCDNIFVSCEYGTSKTQNLFRILKNKYPDNSILHIGDDEFADTNSAIKFGIDTFRIYNGADLFYYLGELGIQDDIKTMSDRIKVGLFVSELFNNAFCFESSESKLCVESSFQIGYLFCAPMITDFVLWMNRCLEHEGYNQILFCARDGYLPGRLFRKLAMNVKSVYFMASRTAAIRAGMEKESDIEYVDTMKYFGTKEKALETRFGIKANNVGESERINEIISKSAFQRERYRRYINELELSSSPIAMFDFVAKGTSQLYLQKLFNQHVKGFYFLQLEPEFMEDKKLDIEPFYTDEEKNTSAIFENYYILETILTSPYSQMQEFDDEGNFVFASETRSKSDISVIIKAQEGINTFFDKYLKLVPEALRCENKKLDEKILKLVNEVLITDEDFLSLKVEDPFFGRMTDIKDVLS